MGISTAQGSHPLIPASPSAIACGSHGRKPHGFQDLVFGGPIPLGRALKIGVLNVGFKLSVSQGEARSLRSLLGVWHCAKSGVYGDCVSASPAVLM